ncbi:MAG: hypothetical protein CMI79_01725 [Candidatus Pelagibacter sp.]|nr:hypothetical protein [Candidatus Pelagibacter sp.]
MLSIPIYYIVLCIVLLVLCIAIYIRLKFQFWSIQPVFHLWDLHHWIFTNKVINPELPEINKYVKLLDVQSINVKEASEEHISFVCDFIKTNYLCNKKTSWEPSVDDIISYLDTNLGKSFIGVYSNTKNSITTKKELLGVITMRPIFINFKDGTKIVANYVDNLTVRKDSRKQGIAPVLMQTHLYQCRRMGCNPVCFFKREGDMTAIVPLTTFETTGYFIKDIPNIKFNVPNAALISIKKTNAQTFINLIKQVEKDYECTVNTELATILSLITNNKLLVYALILQGDIVCCYIFRNTPSFMKTINTSFRIVELICSINKAPYDDIFYAGFSSACRRLNKKWNADVVTIEQVGNNITLANLNERHGVTICTSCPTAFFLYNYARYSVKPKDLLCIY